MADSISIEIASAVQSASIKHNPDPEHDINPSTSASTKEPVTVSHPSSSEHFNDEDEYGIDGDEEEKQEGLPYSPYRAIRPQTRRSHPPLPDLRFEQSYLASISKADTNWKIAWITFRDQLILPLLQGTVWSLVQIGWRHWNASANMSGTTFGSKIRRWWYKTNNWKLPSLNNMRTRVSKLAKDQKLAKDMGEFYKFQS